MCTSRRSGTVIEELNGENYARLRLLAVIEQGDDPRARIALCGYEGEHAMSESWECVQWKARGGYGSQSDNAARDNSHRERIWFSPHCLQTTLFSELKGEVVETTRPLYSRI